MLVAYVQHGQNGMEVYMFLYYFLIFPLRLFFLPFSLLFSFFFFFCFSGNCFPITDRYTRAYERHEKFRVGYSIRDGDSL